MKLIGTGISQCREVWEERRARHQVLKTWGVCDQYEQATQFLACWREDFWKHPFVSLGDLPLVILSVIRWVLYRHVITHIDDDLVNER